MKKLFFLSALLGFAITTIQAQLGKVQKPEQVPLKTIPVKTTPAPAPVTNKTSETSGTNVYKLTSARVSIKTGNDNKEFPSKVFVTLKLRSNPHYFLFDQPGENMRNEMKSNSNTAFGLQKNNEGTPERLTLQALQNEGIILTIYYDPNFFTDAWKIEGVSLTLEFKDQNGNLHPTLGNKTIVFNNANGFLNVGDRWMECTTDGTFSPLTSSIK
jgi:hypothetical protein